MPRKSVNTPGFIYQIALPDGSFAYALMANKIETVFFDINPRTPVSAEVVLSSPVLFRTVVMNAALRRWTRIASVSVSQELAKPGRYYREDALHKGRFAIRDLGTADYNGVPATREECIGLECNAVWSQIHIETRLMDQFAGRQGRWTGPLK